MRDYIRIEELLGKIFVDIKVNNDQEQIIFTCDDGKKYLMFHSQDCCESVNIEDIVGDLDDLLNEPLLMAEEATNSEDTMGKDVYDSFTWTFYRFATKKGYVTIRWYGESNGYYSESVDIVELK